jgi:hypothetical protein
MDQKKRWCILMVIILALVMLGSLVMASDDSRARSTLRGLEAVYVQVESLDPQLKREGLTEVLLQLSTERKVGAAGIKVLPEEDFGRSDSKSILYLNVQILMPEALKKYGYTVEGQQISKPEGVVRYVYRIDLELRQMVSLMRDPTIRELSTTWSTGSLGFRRLSRIKEDVNDHVDAFINAYLAVNLKQG